MTEKDLARARRDLFGVSLSSSFRTLLPEETKDVESKKSCGKKFLPQLFFRISLLAFPGRGALRGSPADSPDGGARSASDEVLRRNDGCKRNITATSPVSLRLPETCHWHVSPLKGRAIQGEGKNSNRCRVPLPPLKGEVAREARRRGLRSSTSRQAARCRRAASLPSP